MRDAKGTLGSGVIDKVEYEYCKLVQATCTCRRHTLDDAKRLALACSRSFWNGAKRPYFFSSLIRVQSS